MTLRPRITPCLLLSDGGLVKTKKFSDPKYVGDPINAVKIFNEKEVDELILLDIDATRNGTEPDYGHLQDIAAESRMPLCYGGGVTSPEQASRLINIGFEKISVSSAAIARPELISDIASAIGCQSVVVTIDVKQKGLFKQQTIHTRNGTQAHKTKVLDFISMAESLGAGEIMVNSIDCDGMMEGYDIEFAKAVRAAVSLPLTIMGGAGSTQDMKELIEAVGIVGAAAGSLFVFKGIYRAVLISYSRP